MSGKKCVIVLAPNGRRQTVNVSPNTTILQILEEVCSKQGFQPEEYDIKHHNHVLDTTSIMRFSGLPNNAQLEMAKVKKAREESNVVLGLQLESGNRLTGTFTPTDSLWDVVKKLCPDEADPDSNPVVVYMRREICGMDSLMETTLRSLGLTSGRAMLRFMHRTAEELRYQANISGPLPKRTVVEEKSKCDVKINSDTPPETPESPEMPSVNNNDSNLQPLSNADCKQLSSMNDTNSSQFVTESTQKSESCEMSIDVGQNTPSFESMDVDSSDLSAVSSSGPEAVVRKEEEFCEEPIILLGERNAIVFSAAMAQTVRYEDLQDDFFNLTVDDVRALYRDLRRQRSEMEDNPLTTKAMRDLEESKRILNNLHNYRRVVLRIQFPDQNVLQGTFTPLETVSTVVEFVKGYLEDPTTPFHLYTTPPKTVLSPQARLVDVNCVPCALIHFGSEKPGETFLRQNLLSQFTSPIAAAVAANRSRGLVGTSRPSLPSTSSAAANPSALSSPATDSSAATGSRDVIASTSQATTRPQNKPSGKVPKWFKTGK